MYLIQTWKQFAVLSLLLVIGILSCKKRPTDAPPVDPPTETPSVYESMLNLPTVSFCGSALTSTLKIKDGTDIGTVTVGHDGVYLYLTYNLSGNWYIGDAHSYAGRESLIPRHLDGNPVYGQFPGKQHLNFCDLRQTFTFRVLLSSVTTDNNAQCQTNEQYYIAMRASVRQISNATDCVTGIEQPAWGAPFLINPGNANEWATALYYCKQDCTVPTITWCAYSQGFWFSNSSLNASWCQNVKFGNLEISEQQGDSLWPPQNNWVRRALFQASALQLSMKCVNSGNAIPTSIVNDYNRLETFLSTLTYAAIQNGTFPPTTDTTGVRGATGNIGRWICNNHCTSQPDPTACTGF
ncbi:MAG TPA: hypothetical protein VFH08_17785 [Chitinophagaceae bacterium]|nr:hypothetical protein [Chitinophagaceae bacterium]